MARHKDTEWNLPDRHQWESIHAALLMDIRDELKRLNTLLYCHNFQAIPRHLKAIRQNTNKKHAKKRKP